MQLHGNQTRVIRVLDEDEQRASAIIFQYDDKDFSYVDATSFAVMERLGIDEGFSFDRHFRLETRVVLRVPGFRFWRILLPGLALGPAIPFGQLDVLEDGRRRKRSGSGLGSGRLRGTREGCCQRAIRALGESAIAKLRSPRAHRLQQASMSTLLSTTMPGNIPPIRPFQ